MPYDLILRGGRVFDRSLGHDGILDVAFQGGRVTAIGSGLDDAQASRVLDVGGALVLPGLVDLHTHVFHRVGVSVDPDVACLGRGTTTALDAGSSGAATVGGLRTYVAERSLTRVYAWVHLSTQGLIDPRVGELLHLAYADVDACVQAIEANRDFVVGIKIRVSNYAVGMSALPVLRLMREAADAARVPVIVHIGASGEPLSTVLEFLRPGDVVTHILTGWPNGAIDPHGKVHPAVLEARRNGVYFDAAQGRMHVDYRVVRAMLEQGFLPDGLSTDITMPSSQDPTFHLPGVMNRLLAMGVAPEDLFPLVTTNPGRLIKREPWLGTLRPGEARDATVLVWEEGEFVVRDSFGVEATVTRRLAPLLAVKDGVVYPSTNRVPGSA